MILYVTDQFQISMLSRQEQRGTPMGSEPQPNEEIGRVARVPYPVDDLKTFIRNCGKCEIRSGIRCEQNSEQFSKLLGVELEQSDEDIILDTLDKRVLAGTKVGDGFEWWVI